MLSNKQLLELACGKIADAAFPHFMDARKREGLASGLVALSEVIIAEAVAQVTPKIHRRRIG